MTLFSAPNDPFSHRTRIVLAEKGISIDIVSVDSAKFPEDLLGFVMKGEDAVILVRVGADAAEVNDLSDSGLVDGVLVGAGPLGDLRHEVIVGVEEAAGGEEAINGVGAFEGSGEESGIFDVADGGFYRFRHAYRQAHAPKALDAVAFMFF